MNIKKILILCGMLASTQFFAGFEELETYVPFTDRLSLRVVQNQTVHSSFKLFYADSDCLGFITPQSVLTLRPSEIFFQQNERLCLQCVKGGFLPIYIKDEGRVSGQAPDGYHGPYYLSMWLEYPEVTDEQKIHVRYIVEINRRGQIGIRIDPTGNCQLLALEHVKFLPAIDQK